MGSLPADHPLPTGANLEAAEAIRFTVTDFSECSGEGFMSTLLVLISGGGSAHLTLPSPGVTLEDIRRVTTALLRSGATINNLNCVRKHCEQLKGGRLAQLAFPGRVRAFVLSDVVGDALDAIASGPCAPDPCTYKDALNVLEQAGLAGDRAHAAILTHLERGIAGNAPETPKRGEHWFDNVTHTVIGNHETALAAAADVLSRMGFAVDKRSRVEGEAATVAAELVHRARQLHRQTGKPCAVIFAGETTVHVRGTGYGGRNQELALAAALELATVENAAVCTFATDGADGTTGNAGAVVTNQTCRMATMLGLEPEAMLKNNDSATFFARLDLSGAGSVIKTDPTGTNVNDIAVALMY